MNMYDLSFLHDKIVLISGGSGSIGKYLVKVILQYSEVKALRILSNDEDALHTMNQETYGSHESKSKIRLLLGDIRDKERLIKASEGVDVIFHLAALKHVHISEYNPFESVHTNVIGTQNIIDAAIINNVGRVILSSSDKAANPSNVLGATKLLSEKLITAANTIKGMKRTTFSSVRFGNVLGSRGSVIHSIEQDIRAKRRVRLTHRDMTRFVISPESAVLLLFRSIDLMKGGEIFVFKMPSVRIYDLCLEILRMCIVNDENNKFEILGIRPGEKLHEDLISEEESLRTVELADMYVVLPTIPELYNSLSQYYISIGATNASYMGSYSSRASSNILIKEDIRRLISEMHSELA